MIEFFNKTTTEDYSELRNKFEELLEMLPEYQSHVKKLGVFVVENISEDNLKEAMRYIGRETMPWVQDFDAFAFYFEKVQAIVISKEKYRKLKENEKKRVILHELAHGICEHKENDASVTKVFQDKYFRGLKEVKAKHVINLLTNIHMDFEADCIVAQKAPEIYLEALYEYTNDISSKGYLETAGILAHFYEKLATLKFLPLSLNKKSKYKKTRDKLSILLKASRVRLMAFTNETLPPVEKIITEADLAELSKLMSCYSKIVGL